MSGTPSLEIEHQESVSAPGGTGESIDLRKFPSETISKANGYLKILGLDPLQELVMVNSYCLKRNAGFSGGICDQLVFALVLKEYGTSDEYTAFTGKYPNIFK
jgi:hypothetical protein